MTPEQAAREITDRFSAALEKTLQSNGASGYSLYADVLHAIQEAERRGQVREKQRWQQTIDLATPNPGYVAIPGKNGAVYFVDIAHLVDPMAEKP